MYCLRYNKTLKKEQLQKETEIITRAQQNDVHAREQLVGLYKGLIAKIANAYQVNDYEKSDIVQEGTIGLLVALQKYDSSRDIKFSTYATWWIRGKMQQYFESNYRSIRLPRNIELQIKKAQKAYTSLQQELERAPTIAEISELMGIDEQKLHRTIMLSAYSISHFLSDKPETSFGADAILRNSALRPDEILERKAEHDLIKSAMQQLSDTERQILALRMQRPEKPYAITEIAKRLSMQEQAVRKLWQQALEKMKKSTRHT